MTSKALLSSDSVEWETPPEFFNKLNDYYNFVIDLAATKENAKCYCYLKDIFHTDMDALLSCYEISIFGKSAFMNPPYGKNIKEFIQRAKYIANYYDMRLVMLLPARIDTRWFHDTILNEPFMFYKNIESMQNHVLPNGITKIVAIKGRINFLNPAHEGKSSSTFPSVLVEMNF